MLDPYVRQPVDLEVGCLPKLSLDLATLPNTLRDTNSIVTPL